MNVATVIVSRNRPDLVESTIEQLRRHDSVPNDIYVIECGTDSDKLTPHTSLCYADPDFRGKCYGHDVGLKLARERGDYDAFFMLMNDLVFDPAIDHVGELVRLLEENPRLALISPTDACSAYPGSAPRPGGGWRSVTTTDYLALMTRAEAIDEVGFLNPDFRYCWGAIHELSYKLYARGWVVGYADGVTYEHLGGTTYGAAGTATIERDEYIQRAKSFAHHYFLEQYGPDWSDVFWKAAAGHGIEINTYAEHRGLWAPDEPQPADDAPKLHLGSGTDYRHGWVNVDIDPDTGPDVVSPAERLECFEDEVAAVIEARHLFEHLTFDEAQAALTEWHRVLRPGGELYLEMPDFEQCVRLLGQHADPTGHDLAMIGIYGWPAGIAQWGHTQVHKWGWTPPTLTEALIAGGFADVEFVPITQTWRPAAAIGRDMRCRARKPHQPQKQQPSPVAEQASHTEPAQAASRTADYAGMTSEFPQVRPITLLAFADEVLENDALLSRFRTTFSADDPVVLVIHCPSETPELGAIVHERCAAAGLENDGPSVALITVPNDPVTHDELTDSADVLYSGRDADAPFISLVRTDGADSERLRALVSTLLARRLKTHASQRSAGPASAPTLPSSPNFLLLTLDSCRYDVMCDARTPVLDRYAAEMLAAQTPANFTYAAHQAFFAGILPHVPEPRAYYNRFVRQLVGLTKAGEGHRVTGRALKTVHSDTNLISGLRESGYQTVGAGAMNWFQQDALTCWFEKFRFTDTDAETQVNFLLEEIDVAQPFFGFINFGETHDPFYYKGKETESPYRVQARLMEWPPREQGPTGRDAEPYWHQVEALEYLDRQLPRLFEALPGDTIAIVCGDHGEAFGEDGYWGHAVNHPKVHEVPLAIFRLDGAPLP